MLKKFVLSLAVLSLTACSLSIPDAKIDKIDLNKSTENTSLVSQPSGSISVKSGLQTFSTFDTS